MRIRIWVIIGIVVLVQCVGVVVYIFSEDDPERDVVFLAGEVIDYSGQYRIIQHYKHLGISQNYSYNVSLVSILSAPPTLHFPSQDVTIATQCSINHLHHLVELANRWKGPISCSVFAPNVDTSYADDAIDLLRVCFPNIEKYVDFHLIYPADHPGDIGKVGVWKDLTCDELLRNLANYGYQNYAVANIPFPHNVLRNAARVGVITEFVLLIDIDTMPSLKLREGFRDFAELHNLFDIKSELTVFVVPAFELMQSHPMPSNKNELLAGVKSGIIRPFHNETCWWCHRSENFDLWKKIPQRSSLDVAFYADWDKSWEPFYISRRNVPLFDERFRQYGFDRIQQICELHVAGYKFAVLNNAFVVHHGWKYRGKFYANKDEDNAQNWILFNYHFKDDLQKKYNTNRTCSPLEIWIPPMKRKGFPKPIAIGNAVVVSRFKPNSLKLLERKQDNL